MLTAHLSFFITSILIEAGFIEKTEGRRLPKVILAGYFWLVENAAQMFWLFRLLCVNLDRAMLFNAYTLSIFG